MTVYYYENLLDGKLIHDSLMLCSEECRRVFHKTHRDPEHPDTGVALGRITIMEAYKICAVCGKEIAPFNEEGLPWYPQDRNGKRI